MQLAMFANYFAIIGVVCVSVAVIPPCFSHRHDYLYVRENISRYPYSYNRAPDEAFFRGDAVDKKRNTPASDSGPSFKLDSRGFNGRSVKSHFPQYDTRVRPEVERRPGVRPDSTDPLRYYWPNRFFNLPANRLSPKSPVSLNNSPRVRPLAERRSPCNSILCPVGRNEGYGYAGLEDATTPRTRQPFRENLQAANCTSLLCTTSIKKR